MTYALNSQEQVTWRQKPYSVSSYVHFSQPSIVLDAFINQTTFNYPISEITYDTATGDFSDIVFGLTVCVRDSNNNVKGFCRIRDNATSSVLRIGHLSQGEINFENNDRITVYRDFRIFSRIPYINPINGEQFKDLNIAYTNQNTNIPPKANAGVWYAAKPISGTTIRVDFHSSASFAMANGATISSRLWDIQDGSLVTGSLSSTDIEVDFPVGERWISLTVTDSNGTSHTSYALVVNNPSPTSVETTKLSGDIENGWEAEFVIHANSVDILEGTPVIHWVEEQFGDTQGSLTGYTDRESIRFVGWVKEVKQDISGLKDRYTVVCVGPLGASQNLPAYSNTIQRVASPSAWHEMSNLTHWRVLYHQIYWHTTLHLMCDIERPSYYNAYPIGGLDVDAGTINNQLKQLSSNVGAKYTCDRHGILYFNSFNPIASVGERNGKIVLVDLTSRDWSSSININKEIDLKYSWIFGQGLLASSSDIPTPFLCKMPGNSPSQGGSTETIGRQLVTSQNELNQRIGDYYYYKNNRMSPITLKINNGGCIVDPAWLQWITVSLDASTNKSGLEFDEQRCYVTSVNVSYNHKQQNAKETWVVEIETGGQGIDAVTTPMPSEETEDTIDFIPPPSVDNYTEPDILTPNDLTSQVEEFDGIAFAFNNPSAITFTRDLPVWEMFHDPSSELYNSLIPDEYSSYFSGDDDILDLYGLTDTNIYFIEDSLSSSPTFNDSLLEDYTLLRSLRGVDGGVAAYGPVDTFITTYSDNFATSLGTDTHFTDGGHPFYTWAVAGAWQSTGGISGGGCVQSTATGVDSSGLKDEVSVYVDLGSECTVSAASVQYMATASGHPRSFRINMYDSAGSLVAGPLNQVTGNSGDTNYHLESWTGSEIGVQFVCFDVDCNTSEMDVRLDNLSVTYEDTNGGMSIFCSLDRIATSNTISIGSNPISGNGCFDVDDYNLGTFVAIGTTGSGTQLFYTSDYSQTDADTVTGITNTTNPTEFNIIRIPYKVFGSNTRNNSPTALRILWGSDNTVSGSTLWYGTLNTSTGAVSSIVDVTPIISGDTYVIADGYGEQLEISGRNSSYWIGCFRNLSDDTIHILRTTNLGTTWIDCGEADLNFVRWSTVGTQSAWLSGQDGIFYTPNRGDSLIDKTENYLNDIGAIPIRGVFSINR